MRPEPITMAKTPSVPTRAAADIAETAAAVGRRESRTMAEQINYWTRLGMQLDRSSTVESRRVRAALTGEEQFSALSDGERLVAHAAVDTAISARVASARFGQEARKAGQVTVSMDEDGNLVEVAADGTRQMLES